MCGVECLVKNLSTWILLRYVSRYAVVNSINNLSMEKFYYVEEGTLCLNTISILLEVVLLGAECQIYLLFQHCNSEK